MRGDQKRPETPSHSNAPSFSKITDISKASASQVRLLVTEVSLVCKMAPNITPQYLNESITDQLFAVAIAFIILDTVFFGLRIISRRYEPAKLGWNDILLVIGWINCIGQAADGLGV